MATFLEQMHQLTSFWDSPTPAAAPAAAAPQRTAAQEFGTHYDSIGERNDCYTPDLTMGGLTDWNQSARPADLPYCPGFEQYAPLGDTLTSNNSAVENTMTRLLSIPRQSGARDRVGPAPDSLGQTIARQHGVALHDGALETTATAVGGLAGQNEAVHALEGIPGAGTRAFIELAPELRQTVGHNVEHGPSAESVVMPALSMAANWGFGPGAGLLLSSMGHILQDGEERTEAAQRDTEASHQQDATIAAGGRVSQQCFEATDHAPVVNGNISLPPNVATDGDCWDGANSALRMRQYDLVGPAIRRQNAAANGGK